MFRRQAAQPCEVAERDARSRRADTAAAEAQQAGRLAEAMRLLRAAAEEHQSVQAYLELARLQSRSEQTAGRSDALAKARALAPNSEEVLSAFAQLALRGERPMPAVLDAAVADADVPVRRAVSLPARRRVDGDRRHAGGVEALTRGRPAGTGSRAHAARARSRAEQPPAIRRREGCARAQPRARSRRASRRWRRWPRPKQGSAISTPRRATRSARWNERPRARPRTW